MGEWENGRDLSRQASNNYYPDEPDGCSQPIFSSTCKRMPAGNRTGGTGGTGRVARKYRETHRFIIDALRCTESPLLVPSSSNDVRAKDENQK